MNTSKCPKCEKGVFQLESLEPIGSNRNILNVICHTCSTVVGSLDYCSNGESQEKTEKQFSEINHKLNVINQNLGKVLQHLNLNS